MTILLAWQIYGTVSLVKIHGNTSTSGCTSSGPELQARFGSFTWGYRFGASDLGYDDRIGKAKCHTPAFTPLHYPTRGGDYHEGRAGGDTSVNPVLRALR